MRRPNRRLCNRRCPAGKAWRIPHWCWRSVKKIRASYLFSAYSCSILILLHLFTYSVRTLTCHARLNCSTKNTNHDAVIILQGRVLLTVKNRTDVTLRGNGGATLRMWRDDYNNASLYKHSEGRHGIALFGSRNILVDGMVVTETGGDGVYISNIMGQLGTPSVNITITNCNMHHNYRQALSTEHTHTYIYMGTRTRTWTRTRTIHTHSRTHTHVRTHTRTHSFSLNIMLTSIVAVQLFLQNECNFSHIRGWTCNIPRDLILTLTMTLTLTLTLTLILKGMQFQSYQWMDL